MSEQLSLFGEPVLPTRRPATATPCGPKHFRMTTRQNCHHTSTGLAISTEAGDAETDRFALLFAIVWDRLPAAVRETLLDWWKQVRALGPAALPDPDVADQPDLAGFDFSRVPLIILADERRDGQRSVDGCCYYGGLILVYYTATLQMTDYGVSELIAHELAHAYMAALGKAAPCPGSVSSGTWKRAMKQPGSGWDERAVEELLVAWGFMGAEHIGIARSLLRNRRKQRKPVAPVRRGRW